MEELILNPSKDNTRPEWTGLATKIESVYLLQQLYGVSHVCEHLHYE